MGKQKLEWFRTVTKEFGSCIKIALSDSVPVGFMQYAPAKYFPRVKEYTSEPPSEDAIFIACLYVPDKNQRGKGFGKAMLKNLIEDLRERGFGTVETFARTSSENNPSGPLKLYLKFNFEVKSEKDDFPLVRLRL
ncbi:MAG: GNAT family N-acetyltransferase [Candidatus Bathycorpusculaceae bacterium]